MTDVRRSLGQAQHLRTLSDLLERYKGERIVLERKRNKLAMERNRIEREVTKLNKEIVKAGELIKSVEDLKYDLNWGL